MKYQIHTKMALLKSGIRKKYRKNKKLSKEAGKALFYWNL